MHRPEPKHRFFCFHKKGLKKRHEGYLKKHQLKRRSTCSAIGKDGRYEGRVMTGKSSSFTAGTNAKGTGEETQKPWQKQQERGRKRGEKL